jgi:hypothetical protein
MKKLLITGLVTAAMTSIAVAGSCSGTQCNYVKITEILATSSGTITVTTDANEVGLSCTTFGGQYMYISATAPGKNALYSALLTAKTTKDLVRLIMTPDSNGYCQITTLYIK